MHHGQCTTETQRHGEDQKAPLRASVVNILPLSAEGRMEKARLIEYNMPVILNISSVGQMGER